MTTEDPTIPPVTPARRATDIPTDAPWWARWFVANVTECWKWLSTWLIAIAAAAPLLYENVAQVKEWVSPTIYSYIQAGLVLLIFFGRVKRQ